MNERGGGLIYRLYRYSSGGINDNLRNFRITVVGSAREDDTPDRSSHDARDDGEHASY